MKRRLLLTTLSCTCILSASAQSPALFTSSEYIDIGNIRAAHLLHGDMWWDPATGTPRCEYPKGSGKHVGFVANLWMGGYDAGNSLHVAAQTYRQKGNDYWPGPIDTGVLKQVSYATSQTWAKIWKVSQTQIDSFKKQTIHTATNTPLSILEWPARNNAYAKGAGGAALIVNQPMAPFVDANNDGVYNPLSGDYPAIKGDQMLWWVINDAGAAVHTVSETNALGVDVKVSAYAYHRNTVLDNVIFYEYQIQNHAAGEYRQFLVGIAADMDIGDGMDDYPGFDSGRRMGFAYNGKSSDLIYGSAPPIAGIAIMELPGDGYKTYKPAGSFITYNNGPGSNGDPANGLEIYRLLSSRNRVGTPLPNGQYQYLQDTLCKLGYTTTDVRFALASDDLSLQPGATIKIGMALVAAPGGGCPNDTLDFIKATTDTALKYYWNPPPPTATAIAGTYKTNCFRLYPNPASTTLSIEAVNAMPYPPAIQIYDALGRTYRFPYTQHGSKTELHIAALPPGIYTVRLQDASGGSAAVFIKE